ILHDYLPDHLKKIERFLRLKEPELSDLRNYSVSQPMSSTSHRRKRRVESPLSFITANTKMTTKTSSISAYTSLSLLKFSEKYFEDFREADAYAFKEKPVTVSVVSILNNNISDLKCVRENYSFVNLALLTDDTLTSARSDHFYNTHSEQLKCQICKKLSSQIVSSIQNDLSIASNFFLEVKDLNESLT
ncbi:hypothetical protein BDBG_17942, partial [Blastomyces gilchristii SLH14081]